MGLLSYLTWCVEHLLSEAESAARWADQFMAVPDRHERARRMLGDLSARVVGGGAPREFVRDLPPEAGARDLSESTAYVVHRSVKTHLYVAGAHGMPLKDPGILLDQGLLLLGAEHGLADFLAALGEPKPAPEVLRRRFPGGRDEAAARLIAALEATDSRVQAIPFPGARAGAFEFLTLSYAADLANAYYDDMVVDAREVRELMRAAAERAVSVFGLLKLTARADGLVTDDEEALLSAVRRVVPAVEEEVLQEALRAMSVERLPVVLRYAEERFGLVHCMLAMACADHKLHPAEIQLCREVAALLEVPMEDVERALAGLPVPLPSS